VKQSFKSGLAIQIRPAVQGDEIGVARVHVRSWQVGYRGLLSEEYLDKLRAEDRAQRYTFDTASRFHPKTLVAVESGVIQGFATIAQAKDYDGRSGAELNALYVHPDCWGRGIGAALESAARASLFQLGYRSAFLWVLAGNARAIGFYESQGWKNDNTSRQAEVWDVTVTEMRYVCELGRSEKEQPRADQQQHRN
jgi:ribosomal protein S18 acetylase RimI-like enzyme